MAYCVNCGVELAPTLEKCPLCFTKVYNPATLDKPSSKTMSNQAACALHPYPEQEERIEPESRKSMVLFGVLVLLIPAVICLLCDWIGDGVFDWSQYILGAQACFFTYALLPLLFKKPRLLVCLALDALVTAAYLTEIAFLTMDLSWVLRLGVPLCALTAVFLYAIIRVSRTKRLSVFYKAAFIVIDCGLFITLIEIILNTYLLHTLRVSWSLIALFPLALVALLLVFVKSNKALKDTLIRRLYI